MEPIRSAFGAIRVLDVGALWTGKAPPYEPLLSDASTYVIGFEPIEEACRALNERHAPRHRFLPFAIGDGSLQSFHRCNAAMTSSLYDPDLSVMDRYHDLSTFCQVVGVDPIQTVRMDDIPEARDADYLKLDIQGAEASALAGATETLRSILAIQTEVEFMPIYRRQPLFADVDRELRSQGFMFWNFRDMEGRSLRSAPSNWATSPDARGSQQQLWADAIYVREFSTWRELSASQLLKFAFLMHSVYRAYDFAAELLARHDARLASNYYEPYCASVFAGSRE